MSTGAFESGEGNTLITKDGFAIDAPVDHVMLNQLTTSGYPFFGGRMTVTIPFEAKGTEKALKLDGRFALAKVSVNGSPARTLMFDNCADIAGLVKPGSNTLTLTLFSSYRNVIGPFHYAVTPEPLGVSPDLFSGYGKWQEGGRNERYMDTYAFTRFGLAGLYIG